jgi:hypothetical protein
MSGYTLSSTTVHNAEGWKVETKSVNIFTAKGGAMTAPVFFHFDSGKTVQPYFISPWQDENKFGMGNDCLKNLRGEFFCLPFGGNGDALNGEQHPCHGEVSGEDWTLADVQENENGVTMEYKFSMKVRPGEVTKKIKVNYGETVLYLSDSISGCSGDMPAGHHPVIRMPADGNKMYLSFGKFDHGMTSPGLFSNPDAKEYQYLAPDAEFKSVEKIPTIFKDPEFADYSVYPSPYGFCDLFSVLKKPSSEPAWTAAVYPDEGFLWFTLKDAAVLPMTSVWVSNSGRFAAPWNGRTYCLGVEDSCSYFAGGLKPSVEENDLNKMGYPTALNFDKTTEIRMIQGVAEIPAGFGKVSDVRFEDGKVIFLDLSGKTAEVKCDYNFVMA